MTSFYTTWKERPNDTGSSDVYVDLHRLMPMSQLDYPLVV